MCSEHHAKACGRGRGAPHVQERVPSTRLRTMPYKHGITAICHIQRHVGQSGLACRIPLARWQPSHWAVHCCAFRRVQETGSKTTVDPWLCRSMHASSECDHLLWSELTRGPTCRYCGGIMAQPSMRVRRRKHKGFSHFNMRHLVQKPPCC